MRAYLTVGLIALLAAVAAACAQPEPTPSLTPTFAPLPMLTLTPTPTPAPLPTPTLTTADPPTRKSTPTLTPTPVLTPRPSDAGSGLPDLIVESMGIQLETGSDCGFISTALGLRVWIRNTGDGYAGPFVVDTAGAQQRITSGLGPGERTSLWFPGYASAGEQTVVVDATFQVEERNEDNNRQTRQLPIPTLPPTCTPTPTQARGVSNLSGSTFLVPGEVGRGALFNFILTLVNHGLAPAQVTVTFQQLGRSDYAEPPMTPGRAL